jgi:hypothetical protein
MRFLQAAPVQGYDYDGVDLRPVAGRVANPTDTTGRNDIPTDDEGEPVRVPLRVRGEEIGALEVWPRDGSLSEAETYLLTALGSRLSQTMESARLYEETQARALREETINRLTASIARSLDLEGVLRSAALELGKLPAVREAAVVLDPAMKLTERPEAAAGPDPGTDLRPESGPEGRTNGGGNGHRA